MIITLFSFSDIFVVFLENDSCANALNPLKMSGTPEFQKQKQFFEL